MRSRGSYAAAYLLLNNNITGIYIMSDSSLAFNAFSVNIFGDNAIPLYEMGYNPLPLRPGTKIPATNNWTNWCENKPETFQVESWASSMPTYNLGIPLGRASDVIALDFDYDTDNELWKRILALIEGSAVKKTGAKGFTAFYRYNGESPKKWYVNGKAVVELLSTGNQTVLPPSIHPDTGRPYKWLTLDTLFNFKSTDLPYLPTDFVQKVDELFGYTKKLTDFSKAYNGIMPELKEIEKALNWIPSNEYATWITVGMALHHSYSDAGFIAWDTWSRKALNYNDKIMDGKWYSFGKASNPVSIGTIFHYAIGYGYHIPFAEPLFDVNPTIILNKKDNKQKQDDSFPEDILNNIPGVLGMMSAWINSTSIKRQPILALGASICALGTIYAHRIRSESDLRTNFMVLGVAESSRGKDSARRCIDSLFIKTGFDHLLLGDFASDSSVITALSVNDNIGFAMQDEIGRELKAINNRHAGGHETRILTTLMKIFTSANSTYRGKQYADNKANPRKDLIQPCLNIYGTSTPDHFYESLTSADAMDGFLARWLIFETKDIRPKKQAGGDVRAIPQNILDAIAYIKTMPTKTSENYSTTNMVAPSPNPIVIPFTDGAREILQMLEDLCEDNCIKEIEKGSGAAAIWGRTREHAIKLALVAHPYQEGHIDTTTMQWAANLALYLTEYSVKAAYENIANSDYEKNYNKIYKIIKRYNDKQNKPITRGTLANAARTLSQQDCSKILEHLIQGARIEAIENEYKGIKYYSYKAN